MAVMGLEGCGRFCGLVNGVIELQSTSESFDTGDLTS